MNNKFYEHEILRIHRSIEYDPVLIDLFHRMFIWANEMGLKGTKVGQLNFSRLPLDLINPRAGQTIVTCMIHEEEKNDNQPNI